MPARRTQSAEARNRAAQRRLRAAGQPEGPLKGAADRWRVFRGQQLGLSKSQARGHPKPDEPSKTELRALGQLPPVAAIRRRPPERRHVAVTDPTGAVKGDIYRSADAPWVRLILRRAGRQGKTVTLRITAQGPDRFGNTVIQTRIIDGRNPEHMEHIRGTLIQAAGRKRIIRPSDPNVRVLRKPHMFVTDDPEALGGAGRGIDPAALSDYLDAYRDWWAAWGDLWALLPS